MPQPAPACPTVTVGDQTVSIRLPGGPVIAPSVSATFPTSLDVAKNLLGQANAAMAPLAPIFNIIDAVLSVKDFAQAVPELITNPGALIEAIGKLISKIAALASLIPQLSVPFLIVDVIDVIIVSLEGIVEQLQIIVAQNARIAAAAAKAAEPGNGALLSVVSCAEGLQVQAMEGLNAGAQPINRLIGILNLLLGLVPPGNLTIPTLENLPPDAEDAVAQLEEVVHVLRTVREAIPIP